MRARVTQMRALGPRLLAVALGFSLIVLAGFLDGGYAPRFWGWTTLVLACVAAVRLILSERVAVSSWELAMLAALAALALWMRLSALWAIAGSDPGPEARRTLLYFAVLTALVLCLEVPAASALVGGAVLGAIAVAGEALSDRVLHSTVVPIQFEGTRLVGRIGYANALAVVAGLGLLLAVALAARMESPWLRRLLVACTPTLSVAVALTDSRGAWLAVAAGVLVTVAFSAPEARAGLASVLLVVVPVDAAAMALARQATGARLGLVLAAATVLLLALPRIRLPRAGLVAALLSIAIVAAALPFVHVSLSSSNRADYWHAAADDVARRPALGSGAGSYRVVAAHASPPLSVRNAHSLYLESLAELGPVGLGLVAAIALIPLLAGVRARRQPLVPVALGGWAVFAVHAGFDWDWQLPVVPLAGFCCASAVLAGARAPSTTPLAGRSRALATAGAVLLIGLALAILAAASRG